MAPMIDPYLSQQILNSRSHEITTNLRNMHAGNKEKVELSAAVCPLIGATTKLDSIIGYSQLFRADDAPTQSCAQTLDGGHSRHWMAINWGYNFSAGRKTTLAVTKVNALPSKKPGIDGTKAGSRAAALRKL